MNTQIDIIPPNQFKTVPWKNGLGETIEVAINQGGTLNNFDWRLSMASVVEDGEFSNFEGYTRNLILIDGNGINLQHNDSKIDKLINLLDIATFDGGNKTVGNLHAGDITDFNIITRTAVVNTKVTAEHKLINHTVEKTDLCFVYSLYREATLTINDASNNTQEVINLPAQHLLKINNANNIDARISGTHLIIIYMFSIGAL
jgi:environmental stress-induced protein Ves